MIQQPTHPSIESIIGTFLLRYYQSPFAPWKARAAADEVIKEIRAAGYEIIHPDDLVPGTMTVKEILDNVMTVKEILDNVLKIIDKENERHE